MQLIWNKKYPTLKLACKFSLIQGDDADMSFVEKIDSKYE